MCSAIETLELRGFLLGWNVALQWWTMCFALTSMWLLYELSLSAERFSQGMFYYGGALPLSPNARRWFANCFKRRRKSNRPIPQREQNLKKKFYEQWRRCSLVAKPSDSDRCVWQTVETENVNILWIISLVSTYKYPSSDCHDQQQIAPIPANSEEKFLFKSIREEQVANFHNLIGEISMSFVINL